MSEPRKITPKAPDIIETADVQNEEDWQALLEFVISDALDNQDFKERLIKALNNRINVPILSEEAERRLIATVYGVALSALRDVLNPSG